MAYDSDDTISKFRQRFSDLTAAFDSGISIHTAMVSFRTGRALDSIGRPLFLYYDTLVIEL